MPVLDKRQWPQISAVTVREIEGKRGELVLPAGTHGHLQACEVGSTISAGAAQLGINDHRSVRNGRQSSQPRPARRLVHSCPPRL
jgi:hypothetical protein